MDTTPLLMMLLLELLKRENPEAPEVTHPHVEPMLVGPMGDRRPAGMMGEFLNAPLNPPL